MTIGQVGDRGEAGGRPIRVLNVGSAPATRESRGGMATVVELVLAIKDPSVEVQHVTTFSDGPRCQRLLTATSGVAEVSRRLRTLPPDVMHVHLSYRGSVLRKSVILALARRHDVPVVIHAHSHGFGAWMDRLPQFVRPVVRHGLRGSRWIVLGDSLRQEYARSLRLNPSRITVVRNPVPALESGSRPVRSECGLIRGLFLGRLGARKGSYDLVDAVARLPREIRDRLSIVMAGDGDVEQVRAAAMSMAVEHAFTFPGWVGPSRRRELLAECDFLVLPSYEEGLPMAVMEAIGAGLPVLTTPVGAIGEVITSERNGLLVSPGDVAALSGALRRLCLDPALRHRLAGAAADTAASLSLHAWEQALVSQWVGLWAKGKRGVRVSQ